ncbi:MULTISPECIES: GTP cyclohydrolase I FolE [unclassified Psychrobacter]|uniref:GTP cyclohydrolase I FolE n=1 Tax=unclassified Psychrobacter TaxID=196806 RepID=UPI001D0F52F9|nr:GTP cyclohydrolase I FolE [Psychrobacter sp. SCQQ22]
MSNTLTITSNYQESADSYRQLIGSTGEDLHRPGLEETPMRAAKAFAHLTQGYHQNLDEVVNDALFPSSNRELVLVQNIEFYSLCEHHMLPFHGIAHVGYLPNGQVLGLSKFARIVDMFARRLQVQENLSEQIAQTIMEVTGCRGVAVVMDAAHMCMMMRGVGKQHSTTRTMSMLGEFVHDNQARTEFLSAIPKRQPAF